jgi:hypothetical protein
MACYNQTMPVPADRTFSARPDCHYLLLQPPIVNPQTLLQFFRGAEPGK